MTGINHFRVFGTKKVKGRMITLHSVPSVATKHFGYVTLHCDDACNADTKKMPVYLQNNETTVLSVKWN